MYLILMTRYHCSQAFAIQMKNVSKIEGLPTLYSIVHGPKKNPHPCFRSKPIQNKPRSTLLLIFEAFGSIQNFLLLSAT